MRAGGPQLDLRSPRRDSLCDADEYLAFARGDAPTPLECVEWESGPRKVRVEFEPVDSTTVRVRFRGGGGFYIAKEAKFRDAAGEYDIASGHEHRHGTPVRDVYRWARVLS